MLRKDNNNMDNINKELNKLSKGNPRKPTFKDYLKFGLGQDQYNALISDNRFLSLDETKELMSIYADYKKLMNEPFNM
tara:strand:- start:351 stop:584 length:234 start_codon:yes stop_codon:yes gene_type:complete